MNTKMIPASIAAVLATAAMIPAAHADVIFNWQDVAPNAQRGPAAGGRIVLSDAAFASGRIDNYRYSGLPVGVADPAAPVRLFSLYEVSTTPATGSGGGGFSPAGEGTFNLSIANGQLSGSIQARTLEAGIRLTGGELWTITALSSDFGNGLCAGSAINPGTACAGGTGRWVLASTGGGGAGGGQVPLPGVLPLMALASFGMALGLRRRKAG